jgi:hypothetical protein
MKNKKTVFENNDKEHKQIRIPLNEIRENCHTEPEEKKHSMFL